jgi:periplasmic protein TonB
MFMSRLSEGRLVEFSPGHDREAAGEALPPCTFHQSGRLSWPCIGAIVALHGALFAALISLNVIPIRTAADRLAVHVVPIEIAPPPPPTAPPEQPRQKVEVQTPIVAPPPIVQTPAPPPVVAVSPAPPPPMPAAVAPAAHAGPPSPAPGPVSISRLAQMPGNPPLKYPTAAKLRHQQGVVRLRITVGTDGRVTDIGIAQSSGFDALDEAAMDVVRRWKFQPPMRDGIAVAGVGIFPAVFKLA